jgi:alkaline phosphatase D
MSDEPPDSPVRLPRGGRPRAAIRGLLSAIALLLFAAPAAQADSFSPGVVAGEVTPTSAIVWAHADQPGAVTLEMATDQSFATVVRAASLVARPASDLTVQTRVAGLLPRTRYWYRFRAGPALSDVGTFATAPRPGDSVDVRFAWTGDYDAEPLDALTNPFWNNFDVFARMRAEGNDFNVGLGDTIYSEQ